MKKTKIDYQPLNGFFDLRNFDLTSKEFKSCWNIQIKVVNYITKEKSK
jgi:hypothetical protein